MLTARPPAKINLTLEILGRRPDGFHELWSHMLQVGLSDRLTMAPGPGPADRLAVTGLAGAPTQGNLVLRALDAIRERTGIRFPPADLTLEKQIPTAAGLGGGSSDAAHVLKLAQESWGVRLARADELALAASLGSDVPFFYFDYGAASVSGRGEHVTPLSGISGTLSVLLVHPPFELSTARVFATYDQLATGQTPPEQGPDSPNRRLADLFLDQVTTDEIVGWAARTPEPNDLWRAAVAVEPGLGELRARLEGASANRWLMSGSGSTLFALYPSVEAAVEAARTLVRDAATTEAGCRINAVDLAGPDPAWRYP